MSYVLLDPDDPTRAIVANGTERLFGKNVGTVIIQNIHRADKCAGEHCIIHNPSDHHMRDWPLVWRDDKGCFERMCSHSVGHPDPDSADFLIRVGKGYLTAHGCDGCCNRG